jgi:hypothetical protein
MPLHLEQQDTKYVCKTRLFYTDENGKDILSFTMTADPRLTDKLQQDFTDMVGLIVKKHT